MSVLVHAIELHDFSACRVSTGYLMGISRCVNGSYYNNKKRGLTAQVTHAEFFMVTLLVQR